MKGPREWLLIGVVAVVAAIGGYTYNSWRTGPQVSEQALTALTNAKLTDLNGTPQSIGQWQGKVVLVNFWATWCEPCRDEIPMLIKLQQRYEGRGLQLVGVAIDQADKVRPYAAQMGMNFPILLGGVGGIELTRELGNKGGVLPYTVVLTRDGSMAATAMGALKEPRIEALLLKLL